ncbi:MAG: hypothetical protein ACPGQQ_01210 [Candidatus Puniceispirillaceae bacterium]|jgi:hypothetical protein
MALSKQTFTDKIETVSANNGSHYAIQVREVVQVLEDGNVISQNYNRYVLQPDADVSTITDATVLAQFNAVMTDQIKQNYQTFLASQNQPEDTEE